MKPVFFEETITKLKSIIDSVTSGSTDKIDINDVTDKIEKSLKDYKDNKENKVLLYGTSIVVVVLSLILTYSTKSSWPLMFMAIWFGGFMYYRVHERSLVLENLDKISKVRYEDPLSKIVFLKSIIDLKLGRKSVLKIFLSVLISSSAMMAHFLFVDSSFWMNLGLLFIAITASYFFWEYFYKEEIDTLIEMKNDLSNLENKIIISGPISSEEEE